MKHLNLVLALLLAISISGMAQNGGQFPENGSVKLEYAGGGKVKVYNKQTGEAVIKVDDGITNVDLTVPASSFVLFTISNGLTANFTVKARTTTNLGSTDLGVVELFIANLPLKFISKKVEYLEKTDEILVTLVVTDVVNVNRVEIEISVDEGHTYKSFGLVLPTFLIHDKPILYRLNASYIRSFWKSTTNNQ